VLSIHPPSGTPVWIDLFDPTEAEIARASRDYGLALPRRDELEEIESSSRLQVDGDVLILSVPLSPNRLGEDVVTTVLGFVLTPKLLVTVRFARLHTFGPVAEKFDAQPTTSAAVFMTILEAMVDYGADKLEEIKARSFLISQRVFHKSRRQSVTRTNRMLRETVFEVGDIGERLSEIRDTLLVMQRIIPFVAENGRAWIGDDVRSRLETAGRDIQSLTDFEVHLTDKLQFLLDATLGFIGIEQNDVFKVLTIASVIGIPPTFIASMYGMNFHNMPEYAWTYGYQWGLGLIVLSIILPTLWFKWRGWW
jgi:magnesium transporter